MSYYQAPAAVLIGGKTIPYTAAALVSLPAGTAQQLVEAEELRWWAAMLGDEPRDIARKELRVRDPKVRAHSVSGDFVYWQATPGCCTCEGEGYLYTGPSRYERECDRCEGSGESGSVPTVFATDMDGQYAPHAPAREYIPFLQNETPTA